MGMRLLILGSLDVERIRGRELGGIHGGGHLDVVSVSGRVLCPHVQTGVCGAGGCAQRPRVGGYHHGLDGECILVVHVVQVCQVH